MCTSLPSSSLEPDPWTVCSWAQLSEFCPHHHKADILLEVQASFILGGTRLWPGVLLTCHAEIACTAYCHLYSIEMSWVKSKVLCLARTTIWLLYPHELLEGLPDLCRSEFIGKFSCHWWGWPKQLEVSSLVLVGLTVMKLLFETQPSAPYYLSLILHFHRIKLYRTHVFSESSCMRRIRFTDFCEHSLSGHVLVTTVPSKFDENGRCDSNILVKKKKFKVWRLLVEMTQYTGLAASPQSRWGSECWPSLL